ncbi:MAG TPA: tetratricopeptide repeat protein [Bryobacteraceae bacterium]|nr:tetratricopeptide repeat protein [Bryobacteraceae bacterium]
MKSSVPVRRTPRAAKPNRAAERGRRFQSIGPAAPGIHRRLSWLWLPTLLTPIFASFALLPRVHANPHLSASFLTAAAFLFAALCALWWSVARAGRALTCQFVPRPVHWVQMIMHSSVFAYWGWYWPEVYHEIPLIAAQVVFLYVFDMLVCWLRRDHWILGFGPIPIVFSTNLFLWFRDDWFYFQFAMIALIVLGKEFLKWKRDGRSVHIFNPSAFALFLVSVVLLAARGTPLTWGVEISTTFNNPPNIYLEIFLLGLIVQALFSVTLVTLSAAAMLVALNFAYLGATGMYRFIDFNIHPAVFLGLHLLVTDPATSPRKNLGKAIFGAAYGAGVFVAFSLLDSLGAPTFYDKLLCVPALNLTVRALDRASIALAAWFARKKWVAAQKFPFKPLSAWTPQQANFAFMGLWAALFGLMFATGFLGGKHPGSDPGFWEKACQAGRTKACQVLAHILDVQCQHNSARGCFHLGTLLSEGGRLPRDPFGAARSFKHACDIGLAAACDSVMNLAKTDGDDILLQPCKRGDGESCFMLGALYYGGQGVARNLEYSAALFQQSCDAGFARGCGQIGESYLFGEGVPKDIVKARRILESACDAGYAPGCFNVGVMHRQGIETPKNESLAEARFRRGCDLGYSEACQALDPSPSLAK